MSASRSELGRGTPLRVTDRASAPRLDDLARSDLLNGTMLRLVSNGVPGVTANPTIVARAQRSSDVYDDQIHSLLTAGRSVEDVYWDLATTDVATALEVLRPTFDSSDGEDGFVSIEVAPDCAEDAEATKRAARGLHDPIHEANVTAN